MKNDILPPMFPDLERRRNELWNEWNRLRSIYPQDHTAIRAAHDAATKADQEWAAAYEALPDESLRAAQNAGEGRKP